MTRGFLWLIPCRYLGCGYAGSDTATLLWDSEREQLEKAREDQDLEY